MRTMKMFLAIYIFLLTICLVWCDCNLEDKEGSTVKINCNGGDLMVSQNLTESLSQASEVIIHNVCIEEVSASVLKLGFKFEKLTLLSVSSTCRATIAPNTFIQMIKLKTLILHLNLDRIDPESLKGLGHLKHLDLSHNNISILTDGTFGELVGLETLILNGNSIEVINETGLAFKSLQNVTEINLADNNIRSLGTGTFSHRNLKNNLQKIDLSGNKINSIHNAFNDFKNLVSLNLNNNPIKTWQSFLTKEVKVDKLYLFNTSISDTDLEYISQESPNIQEIFLGKNEINQWENIFERSTTVRSQIKFTVFNESNPMITYNDTTLGVTSQSPTESSTPTIPTTQPEGTDYTQPSTEVAKPVPDPHLSTGAIVAIVLAAILFAAIACFVIFKFKRNLCFRQANRVQNNPEAGQGDILLQR